MTPAGLTPKREKFAQAVASGLNQSDAYRASFEAGGMKASSINVKASQLMADGKVRVRVEELRKPIAEAVGITLESHLRDLLALRNLAAKEKQMSAAISAEVARGKAAGVVVDRAALELTGKNGAPIAMTAISTDEFRRIALEVAGRT
jgi:hypothetical protein